jgi:MFS family permease
MPSTPSPTNEDPAPRQIGTAMLFRFSLYGFLKNQQYYEPFLILVFREKGLSFLQIGTLVAFREICLNLFEIPSGAVADLSGRRRSMILSMLAYIASFSTFALSRSLPILFVAMFFFALGDAFRTGTHKAMIFDWLRLQGRTAEKTKIYGYTRSWSKMGSAVSVVIAAALVFYTGSYNSIFWFCLIPYVANIINFLGYPVELEGDHKASSSPRAIFLHLVGAFREAFSNRKLRRLLAESMCFEGLFKAAKDYLQPIVRQSAIALPVLLSLADQKRTAVLIGIVYFVLHLMSSLASRHAHRVVDWQKDEDRAAHLLWLLYWGLFAALIPLLWFQWNPLVITVFVGLAILQNFWRPLLVGRVNTHSDPAQAATVLSIESQSKSLATMFLAPFLGWAMDRTGEGQFWPIGVVGCAIVSVVLLTSKRSAQGGEGKVAA